LYKYDGFTANPVVLNDKEVDKIISSEVISIYQDSKGFWWISTYHGLVKYNCKEGRGIAITLHGSKDLYINTVKEDNYGRIWVKAYCRTWANSKSKIYVLNNKDFVDISCEKEINYFSNQESELLSNKKNIWAIVYNKVYKINPQTFSIDDSISLNTSTDYLFTSSVYLDNNNSLWISYPNGLLLKCNIKTKKVERFDIKEITHNSSACVYITYSKTNDKIWFSIDKEGFWYYDYKKQTFEPFITASLNSDELPSYQAEPIFIDRENNYWFGIYRNGLVLTNSNLNCTQSYIIKGATNSSVSAIFKDSNKNIWIGTDGGGLYQYDSLFNCKKQFTKSTCHSLTDNSILSIFEDSQKRLWIGTYMGGLFLYDKTNQSFKNYHYISDNKNSILGNDIRSIKEDKNGVLWIVVDGKGITCFDTRKEIFTNYTLFNSPWILDLLIDSKGVIWAATSNGISRKMPSSNVFSNSIDEHKQHNFPVCVIKNFCEDNAKAIWIGTDNGLYYYSNTAHAIVSEIPFFKGYEIKSISKNNNGELFIATNSGLYKYTIATKNIIRINTSNKTIGEMFVINAACIDKNSLLLGTSKGVYKIATNFIDNQKTETKPVITDIKLFNNSLFPLQNDNGSYSSISFIKEISLKYYENNISFEFANPTFKNITVDYQFEYMLDGADKQWHKTTSNHIDYPNISPGNYEFKVRVFSGNSVANANYTSIKVIISPPYWKTWWFKLLLSFLLIALTFILIRQRLERLKKQAFLLEQKVFERTQQILAQKDEIILQSEKVKAHADKLQEINSELVKTHSEQTKLFEIVSQMNGDSVSEVSIPKTYEEKILEKTINYINEHINDTDLTVEVLSEHANYSKVQFYRIIKNLTELTPNDIIKTIRLQKAKEMLSTGKYSVSDVCYQVGFNDPKYFRKCFKEYYNLLPSDCIPK